MFPLIVCWKPERDCLTARRHTTSYFLFFRLTCPSARGCTKRPGEPVGEDEAVWRNVVQ